MFAKFKQLLIELIPILQIRISRVNDLGVSDTLLHRFHTFPCFLSVVIWAEQYILLPSSMVFLQFLCGTLSAREYWVIYNSRLRPPSRRHIASVFLCAGRGGGRGAESCDRKKACHSSYIYFNIGLSYRPAKLLRIRAATLIYRCPSVSFNISWILMIFLSWSIYGIGRGLGGWNKHFKFFTDGWDMGHVVFATACAVYARKLLPHEQCALANCYRMRSVR